MCALVHGLCFYTELVETAAIAVGLGSLGHDGVDWFYGWIHWFSYASAH